MAEGQVTSRDRTPAAREALAERTLALFREAEASPARRQQIVDEVVTTHLWLAESLARRFGNRGEDDEDLLQVARTGLVEAARRFDPSQGAFLGFAIPTISGVLKRHFRDHGWVVRPPRRTQELASLMWRQWPELVQCLGALPTDADLARRLGTSPASVRQARSASLGYHSASIDAALSRGLSFESADGVRELERTEARLIIAEALCTLSDAERTLLRLRFCDQRSQADIAAELGTSQMQVSRLLGRVLGKLRVIVGSDQADLAS